MDMCSGLKILVDGGDVSHNTLPVRSFCMDHVSDVQSGLDAHTFCCLEGQGEISSLVLTVELLVGNVSRQVRVKDSTEGKSIIPAAAEVSNVNVLITLSLLLTPPQQCISFGTTILSSQR